MRRPDGSRLRERPPLGVARRQRCRSGDIRRGVAGGRFHRKQRELIAHPARLVVRAVGVARHGSSGHGWRG